MSEKLWWSLFGLWVLIGILALITEWLALIAMTILGAIALAVCTWLKYRAGRQP